MTNWKVVDLRRLGLNPLGDQPKRVNLFAPFRSKTELAYARYLSTLQACGEIESWEYEPERWPLAHRCVYVPDFRVKLPDGTTDYHEVKGAKGERFYCPPKNWIKLKVAAAKYRDRAVYAVWPADRRMTAWKKERVKGGEVA